MPKAVVVYACRITFFVHTFLNLTLPYSLQSVSRYLLILKLSTHVLFIILLTLLSIRNSLTVWFQNYNTFYLFLFIWNHCSGRLKCSPPILLFFNFTDWPGERAFRLATLKNLEQLLHHPRCFFYHFKDQLNILNFFLSSHFSTYFIEIFHFKVPLITISYLQLVWSNKTSEFSLEEAPVVIQCHQLRDLMRYIHDFPWNDFCNPCQNEAECAKYNTEVITSGPEECIPNFSFLCNSSNSWCNHTYFPAIQNSEKYFR